MPKAPMPKAPLSKAPKSTAGEPQKPSDDVALICGRTDDGKGLHVIRKRGTGLEAGVVQPLEDGKPIHGELVTLRQRGQSAVCDVEVHYDAAQKPAAATTTPSVASETRGHPAQVASDSYRKNWDSIWKTKPKKALLN